MQKEKDVFMGRCKQGVYLCFWVTVRNKLYREIHDWLCEHKPGVWVCKCLGMSEEVCKEK